MSNANAICYEATARSETRKLARVPTVCDPRAAPPGEYGLGSGKNGHLARANGVIDGPYCSPTWPSAFGRRCEPLAGRLVGLGAELLQRPQAARGLLLPFECLTKKNARCPGLRELLPTPEGLAGMAELAPLFSGGSKPLLCHNSQALSDVQEENALSCARGQVAIDRKTTGAGTPMALSALSCE
jgi:hypothetical protein